MRPDAETPSQWMELARSDLAVAAARTPGAIPSTLCFLAQQAAEKAVKAVLLMRRIEFPRTHNMGALIDLVPDSIDVPLNVQRSALLTRYAVDTRYPGTQERPTWEDYERALRAAEAVVGWADQIVGRPD